MTRRGRLQLSSVDQVKSLKRRAGPPVCSLCCACGVSNFGRDRRREAHILGQAEQVIDAVRSHQCISSSRANPASARNKMRTRGQRARM